MRKSSKKAGWRKLFGAVAASCFLAACLGLAAGCGGSGGEEAAESSAAPEAAAEPAAETTAQDIDYNDWDAVVEAARGTTVVYAGYSGDEALNEWLTGPFTETLKEKYDITLEYAQDVDITTMITDAIAAEADETSGTFDVGWINGASFAGPQRLGGYFGPITDKLPNFEAYIDTDSVLTNYDFTEPIEGYECPFSFAELNIIKDDAVTPGDITTPEAFEEFVKANPGKVSYITPEHWLGAALIRSFIYNIVGYEQFQTMEPDYDTVKAEIEPVLTWLRDLNPYLWKEGTTFPADHADMEQKFLTGELCLVQTYGQYDCGFNIKKEIYPDTCKSYLLSDGMASNYSYWGIPYNAPNKAGALVVVNEMIDPAMQLEKAIVGEGFVTDLSKVDEETKTAFESIDFGPGNCTNDELQDAARPEYSSDMEAVVAEIWLNEVLGKTNE